MGHGKAGSLILKSEFLFMMMNSVYRQEHIISDRYSLNTSNSGKNEKPVFLPTLEFS